MDFEKKPTIPVPVDVLNSIATDLRHGAEQLDKLIQQHHSASPVPKPVPTASEQDYPDPPTETREPITIPPGPAVQTNSGFRFGQASLTRLATVHPMLQDIARRAINITTQDFTVFEGVRTIERQRELMARGVTRTLNSRHLRQPDGWSHAMDLVPWIGGRAVWDWDGCYRIAYAVDRAATEQGVAHRIRWGGAWDRTLADFGGSPAAYAAEVQAYRRRRGGRAFLDGVHYEIV